MQRTQRHHSRWFFLLSCCLVIFLAACSAQPASGGGSGQTGTGGSTPGATPTKASQGGTSGQPNSMPPTSTNCPTINSGRAAVLKTLALGSDQNLVYVYKDPSSTWHLRRYDARTGQKTDIYTTSSGQIEDAQISADGQWVVFLLNFYPAMRTEASAKIQLIRMDSQGLQTLYCFSTNEAYSQFGGGSGAGASLPVGLQLSIDQKSLLFSVDTNNHESTVYDLNMGSGKVQEVYQDTVDPLYTTSIVTWLDNSDAYLLTQGRTQPAPPATIRLLNVAEALTNASYQPTQVFQGGGRQHELSVDTSFDGATLYTDDCLLAGSPYKTTVMAQSSHAGGVSQTLYQPPASLCVDAIRVISNNAMLMLVTDQNVSSSVIQHEVWTMNLNGTAQHGLVTLPTNDSLYQFNPNSQYVWSNVSRDGSMYALQQETNNNTENLVFGPVNGGNVTTLASSSANTLMQVGWTTM